MSEGVMTCKQCYQEVDFDESGFCSDSCEDAYWGAFDDLRDDDELPEFDDESREDYEGDPVKSK